MTKAAIQTELDNLHFVPGELLRGRVGWQSDTPVTSAELRLFYYTKGKGTRDVDVVDTCEWVSPPQAGQEQFSFQLPKGPYSFSGELVSLLWALELVLEPGGHTERLEFVLSPTAEEINLLKYPVPPELAKLGPVKKWLEVHRNR